MQVARITWIKIAAFIIAFAAIGIGWAHAALGDRFVSSKKSGTALAQHSQQCDVKASLEQDKSQEGEVFYVGCAGFF